jgi:Fe-S cluster assembly protein SufD
VTDTVLADPGASVEATGLFFADDRQHMDFSSHTRHEAPHTTANILLNGVVKDAAHAAFAGTIRVERWSQGTQSYLGSHALTLSDEARMDVVPSLEIETNDVRVSHGSTAGKLDEEQLFYLMARGLSRARAARTLVRGFFEPVLSRVPLRNARERIERALERKLPA